MPPCAPTLNSVAAMPQPCAVAHTHTRMNAPARTHARTDGRTDGWSYRRVDRRTDGRTDGWTDGRTDARSMHARSLARSHAHTQRTRAHTQSCTHTVSFDHSHALAHTHSYVRTCHLHTCTHMHACTQPRMHARMHSRARSRAGPRRHCRYLKQRRAPTRLSICALNMFVDMRAGMRLARTVVKLSSRRFVADNGRACADTTQASDNKLKSPWQMIGARLIVQTCV